MTNFKDIGRLTKTLLIVSTIALTAGCASQPKSQAYKVNQTLGGHTVNDAATNEEHQQSSPVLKHGILIAGSAATTTASSSLSLSGLSYEGLAVSLVTAALDIATTKTFENTWIVGYVPKTEGVDAREQHERIFDAYDAAMKHALDEMGLEYKIHKSENPVRRGEDRDLDELQEFKYYLINAPEFGCEYVTNDQGMEDSTCAGLVNAGGLETAYAPKSSEYAGQEVWRFGVSSGHNARFIMNEAQLPTIELHQVISEKLPSWAFMFMPDSPNYRLLNVNGAAKGYPYFLNQGKELHFVTPEVATK